ncbi:MAG: DUF2179 domain-containing protein [Rhodobacterales bacterium]|nr:DUF2179 domain-containing protein [Rhodobacterales bacterium]
MVEFTPPTLVLLQSALLIFCLRIGDVSLGTLRLIMIAKGHRQPAAILGFFEVTIWILAVSQVLTGITNIWTLLGYSGGYAAGTSVGMLIESHFNTSKVEIRVISPEKSQAILESLSRYNVSMLEFTGAVSDRKVPALMTIVPKPVEASVLSTIRHVDPDAYVVMEDVQRVIVPKIAR